MEEFDPILDSADMCPSNKWRVMLEKEVPSNDIDTVLLLSRPFVVFIWLPSSRHIVPCVTALATCCLQDSCSLPRCPEDWCTIASCIERHYYDFDGFVVPWQGVKNKGVIAKMDVFTLCSDAKFSDQT